MVTESKLQIVDILPLENEVQNLKQKENEGSFLLQEVRKELIVCEEKLNEIEKCKKLQLEKEANRVLSRLTDNQMHVALRTQREKKSQEGLAETLDVIIADTSGTRNYELYSGGEAFKIDFALRLALSRLLTNKQGAKLQTLIIDEGFGSQDTSGKERLVEVIKSIEKEFELILVVTHIDELKESFPTQIQVTKDDEG